MGESIYTLIREEKQVNDWLLNHKLSAKLKAITAKVEEMVRNESDSNVSVDKELQGYCGDYTEVNNQLQEIQLLRAKEQDAKSGLIGIAVLAIIVIGLIIWVFV